MLKLARLKPFFQVGCCLVLVGLALNMALTALDRTPVLAWLPETVTGTGFLEESRTRVAQAVQEYRDGRVSRKQHLATIVGISNVREAIELSVLSKGVGDDWRFLGVGGAGFGMDDVGRYADLVLSSDLRPDATVVGFGLHQLADARPTRNGLRAAGALDPLRKGNLRQMAVAVRNSAWLYSRRRDVRVTTEWAALDARAWLFGRFGVRIPQADDRSPWGEMIRSDWPDHFSQSTLRAQEQMYADKGVFDPETYQRSRKNISVLLHVIDQFRRQHTKVVLVLLPEHSRLNQRIPAQALEVFNQHVRERFANDAPPVLDFRQAVDDSGLVDLPHLNQKGRIEFSRKLAETMREVLSNTSTPVARRTDTDSSGRAGTNR
jgi:hypothetical protein